MNRLKKIDRFAHPVGIINLAGNTKYGTVLGGIFTILTSIAFVAYHSYLVLKFVNHEAVFFSQSKFYQEFFNNG